MAADEVLDILMHSPFFAGFDAADLRFLAAYADVHTYKPGSWLFHESAPHQWFGVIVQGEVELVREFRGRTMRLGTAGVGAALGAGALSDTMPHAAGAYARAGAIVLRVSKVAVSELRCARPKLLSQVSARAGSLALTSGTLAAVPA